MTPPPKALDRVRLTQVLDEVFAERLRQHELWGEQNIPSGEVIQHFKNELQAARERFDYFRANHKLTWNHILEEEFWEAMCESDPQKRRVELIQVAAVAVSEVECIDRAAAKAAAEKKGGAA